MFGKKFFLKRIRIRQEMDLKIPKALSNRVFDNGYSKHFRDMTSGTKLKKMIKEHVCIEIQTIRCSGKPYF